MKKRDPAMQIVRCDICGEFTIRAGGKSHCPSGCKSAKAQVVTTVRIPYKWVETAMTATDA